MSFSTHSTACKSHPFPIFLPMTVVHEQERHAMEDKTIYICVYHNNTEIENEENDMNKSSQGFYK